MQIGMTVKVLPDAEYGGKYTGCVGVVKNYYSSKKKAGVELEKVQNDASSKGLFWFSEDKLAPANDFLGSVSKIMNAMNCRCSFPLHHTGVPPVKKVIFSGPKTIVLWADGTKTIVSCGAGDTYDYYAGFCAAVVKKLFGSTTHAKKVLGEVVQVKITLFQHQQQALDLTEGHNRCAYYLDMGLGKTFVGSEKALTLNSRVNLLICQCSKVSDWIDHMVENYAMNHCWMIYDLTNKKEFDWIYGGGC